LRRRQSPEYGCPEVISFSLEEGLYLFTENFLKKLKCGVLAHYELLFLLACFSVFECKSSESLEMAPGDSRSATSAVPESATVELGLNYVIQCNSQLKLIRLLEEMSCCVI